jgi:hypothetical protein
MIYVYGKGKPGDLARRILHHARGISELTLAITAGLWAHNAHRDENRRHELHIGKGANGWALYLDNGRNFAFRGVPVPGGDYGGITVHEGSVRPLGPAVLTIQKPRDVDALWRLLDDALDSH